LNVHLHALVFDCVFARAGDGRLRFHRAPAPTAADVLAAPVRGERLSVAADGRVVLRLRHPWADGTTHLGFEPTAFLERLGVLVPRPRINLLLYYGVLAPHAAWRAEVVPRWAPGVESPDAGEASGTTAGAAPGPAGRRWADLMRRAFDVGVLACPWCGGRLRLLALLEAGTVTARILRHLGLPPEVPPARPARAPPLPGDDESW